MLFIRSTFFNIFMIGYSLLFSLGGSIVLCLPKKYIGYYCLWWVKVVLWGAKNIALIDFKVIGIENIPKEPCILASKHQSMMETLIIPHTFNYAVPILKQQLLNLPLWGHLIGIYGAIGVDRASKTKAIRQMQQKMDTYIDRHFFIFPEGTRSSINQAGDYQSGVYMIYRLQNRPVVPIAVNTGLFWPRRGWMKHPGTATVQILPIIQPGLPKDVFMRTLEESIETASRALVV